MRLAQICTRVLFLAGQQRAVKAALMHPQGSGKSDRQIAAHVGVDHQTVANWRAKLTGEIRQSDVRTGRDGRTINTANIGRRPEAQQQQIAPDSA